MHKTSMSLRAASISEQDVESMESSSSELDLPSFVNFEGPGEEGRQRAFLIWGQLDRLLFEEPLIDLQYLIQFS